MELFPPAVCAFTLSFAANCSTASDLPPYDRKASEVMTATHSPTPGPQTPEAAQLEQAMFEIKKVIVGQDRVIERLMVCLLSRGHCLLEGVPGLAKTLAVETLA